MRQPRFLPRLRQKLLPSPKRSPTRCCRCPPPLQSSFQRCCQPREQPSRPRRRHLRHRPGGRPAPPPTCGPPYKRTGCTRASRKTKPLSHQTVSRTCSPTCSRAAATTPSSPPKAVLSRQPRHVRSRGQAPPPLRSGPLKTVVYPPLPAPATSSGPGATLPTSLLRPWGPATRDTWPPPPFNPHNANPRGPRPPGGWGHPGPLPASAAACGASPARVLRRRHRKMQMLVVPYERSCLPRNLLGSFQTTSARPPVAPAPAV